MPFVEHLEGFFVDMGESVVLGTGTVSAIVDAPVDMYNQVLAEALDLTVIEARIAGVAAGAAATVRGTSYTVRTIESRGDGLALLRLTKP